MRHPALPVVAAVLLLAACDSKPKERGIGEQTRDITADTRTLEDATAAANAVIRNATDCDVVKASLPDTNRRLDEAAAKLATPTGRTTLEALRNQVKTVAQSCP
jgi:hypothetical protein